MLVTFTQLRILFSLLFSLQRKTLVLLIVGQLCVTLVHEVVVYVVGILPSKFYLVLDAEPDMRSESQFTTLAIYSICCTIIMSLVKACKMLLTGLIYVNWRDVLTTELHESYFASHLSTYRANYITNTRTVTGTDTNTGTNTSVTTGGKVDDDIAVLKDNPDQRIASDARAVCDDLSQMLPVLFVSPFVIGYYTYQSNRIAGYIGPITVFTFFILATIFNLLLMRPVAKWTYEQERCEGDFRYCHMLNRTHCESSALYNVNKLEEQQTANSLSQLLSVQEHLMYWKWPQNLFITLCDYIVSIISFIVIALPIFAGAYDSLGGAAISSTVSQFSFQTMYLFNCFTTLIDLAKQAAVLLGNTRRVTSFVQTLQYNAQLDRWQHACATDKLERPTEEVNGTRCIDSASLVSNIQLEVNELQCPHPYIRLPFEEGDTHNILVSMEAVEIMTPSNRLLVSDLTFNFKQGNNVLISGPSGSGKSSILRLIGGLWTASSGVVTVRGEVGIAGPVSILPQRPYFLAGESSLSDQVFLGHRNGQESVSESLSECKQLLEDLGLDELMDRYGGLVQTVSTSWYDTLTPGEAQRLAMVRALYHRPRLLFLDETTSQVQGDIEGKFYSLLQERNITYVSVGHSRTLTQYHTQELRLLSDSTHHISNINV